MNRTAEESLAIESLRQRFNAIRIDTDVSDMFDFGADLLELQSPEALDFHYALLRDTGMDGELYDWLCRKFSDRGDAGEDHLHARFAQEQDASLQATVLQMLGTFKYRKGRRLKDTAALARAALGSPHDDLRCKGLWVIGWLGTTADIAKVAPLLAKDPVPANRHWAASALMQIFFNHRSAAPRALACLREALEAETDAVVLGGILVAVQEIAGKKFGLASNSHEAPSAEKLEAALAKARRMFARAA
ncbi:HEAT repeat domain-containing protein [Variovorax sp. ZS18.2.2]|uniref:HEAT repeat domain-containing protein n=1 Tax=Variovorax sp. ZS18.2.2 TaxID=2971255 RepID=UPI002150D824|nr:HEAT repeat domain-containing protein [Variovorax sp. ZS18.2.2]MCR6479062.1 HEAT repeat domain-containing protein [Variovorax sp. ZS18.2.2]